MVAFENDSLPRQIAARSGAARPSATASKAIMPAAAKSTANAPAGQAGGPAAGGFQMVFEAELRASAPPPGTHPAPVAKQAAAGGGGFQMVFEADDRSLSPGTRPAPMARPAVAGDGGFRIVFEAETLPPLPPPQTQSANLPTQGAAGREPGKVPLWDNGGFGFSDILDVINPLQHLPIISTIYRAETGDQIGAIPRILGAMLYGGGLVGAVVGAATAVVNLAVEQETGKDIGGLIYTAIFGEGGKNAKTTTLATNPAPQAAAGSQAATTNRQTPVAVPQPAPGKTAIAPASTKPKPTPSPAAPAVPVPVAPAPAARAGPPGGGVRVTGKADPRTSLSAAAASAITSQFRRAAWYRRNQDTLAAQATELVRAKAAADARAAKRAAASGGPGAKGPPDMLGLFTGSAATTVKSGAGAAKSAATPKAPVALEMSKALAKYEQLLKSRVGADPNANQTK